MRHTILLTLIIGTIYIGNLNAQGAKKYALVEHFTNTRCPICAQNNPSILNAIEKYKDDVHHISYHPPIPYSQCVFYQKNPEGNDHRRLYYSIVGTPKALINGVSGSGGGMPLSENKIESVITSTSSIYIAVEENEVNGQVMVDISITKEGDLPTTNLRVFAAKVSTLIAYDAPNGEKEHHNVFQKWLGNKEGFEVSFPEDGSKLSYNFSYNLEVGEVKSSQYAMVFVQNMDNKEILNSGTRYDAKLSSIKEDIFQPILSFPNPIQNLLHLNKSAKGLKIFDMKGNEIFVDNRPGRIYDVSFLPKGIYIINAYLDSGKIGINKMIKL